MRVPKRPRDAPEGDPPGVGRGGRQKGDAQRHRAEQERGGGKQQTCGGKGKTAQNLAEQAALAAGLSDTCVGACVSGFFGGTRPPLGAVGILAGLGTVIHRVLLYVNDQGGRFQTCETIILQKPYAFCHIRSPPRKNFQKSLSTDFSFVDRSNFADVFWAVLPKMQNPIAE